MRKNFSYYLDTAKEEGQFLNNRAFIGVKNRLIRQTSPAPETSSDIKMGTLRDRAEDNAALICEILGEAVMQMVDKKNLHKILTIDWATAKLVQRLKKCCDGAFSKDVCKTIISAHHKEIVHNLVHYGAELWRNSGLMDTPERPGPLAQELCRKLWLLDGETKDDDGNHFYANKLNAPLIDFLRNPKPSGGAGRRESIDTEAVDVDMDTGALYDAEEPPEPPMEQPAPPRKSGPPKPGPPMASRLKKKAAAKSSVAKPAEPEIPMQIDDDSEPAPPGPRKPGPPMASRRLKKLENAAAAAAAKPAFAVSSNHKEIPTAIDNDSSSSSDVIIVKTQQRSSKRGSDPEFGPVQKGNKEKERLKRDIARQSDEDKRKEREEKERLKKEREEKERKERAREIARERKRVQERQRKEAEEKRQAELAEAEAEKQTTNDEDVTMHDAHDAQDEDDDTAPLFPMPDAEDDYSDGGAGINDYGGDVNTPDIPDVSGDIDTPDIPDIVKREPLESALKQEEPEEALQDDSLEVNIMKSSTRILSRSSNSPHPQQRLILQLKYNREGSFSRRMSEARSRSMSLDSVSRKRKLEDVGSPRASKLKKISSSVADENSEEVWEQDEATQELSDHQKTAGKRLPSFAFSQQATQEREREQEEPEEEEDADEPAHEEPAEEDPDVPAEETPVEEIPAEETSRPTKTASNLRRYQSLRPSWDEDSSDDNDLPSAFKASVRKHTQEQPSTQPAAAPSSSPQSRGGFFSKANLATIQSSLLSQLYQLQPPPSSQASLAAAKVRPARVSTGVRIVASSQRGPLRITASQTTPTPTPTSPASASKEPSPIPSQVPLPPMVQRLAPSKSSSPRPAAPTETKSPVPSAALSAPVAPTRNSPLTPPTAHTTATTPRAPGTPSRGRNSPPRRPVASPAPAPAPAKKVATPLLKPASASTSRKADTAAYTPITPISPPAPSAPIAPIAPIAPVAPMAHTAPIPSSASALTSDHLTSKLYAALQSSDPSLIPSLPPTKLTRPSTFFDHTPEIASNISLISSDSNGFDNIEKCVPPTGYKGYLAPLNTGVQDTLKTVMSNDENGNLAAEPDLPIPPEWRALTPPNGEWKKEVAIKYEEEEDVMMEDAPPAKIKQEFEFMPNRPNRAFLCPYCELTIQHSVLLTEEEVSHSIENHCRTHVQEARMREKMGIHTRPLSFKERCEMQARERV